MKTFALFSVATVSVGWMCAYGLPAQNDDKPNFALVEKLPEREIAAKKTAHDGWDSNVRPKMLAATDAYNDALTGMVTDLVTTYYGKARVTKEDVAAYVKSLKSAAEFRHRLDNPSNDPVDTLDALEAPSVVSNDLEDTIEQMVEAVSSDDEKFDYPGWEKRWEAAKKTGDKPDEVAPTGAVTTAPKGATGAVAAPQDTPPEKRDKAD